MLCTSFCLLLLSSVPAHAGDPGWPRQLSKGGSQLIIYQPQIDDWRNFTELDWRMAVSLTPKGGKEVVGVVELHGRTIVDNDTKTVLIDTIQIKKTNFPALDPGNQAKMDKMTRTFLPQSVSISLERLVACVPKKDTVKGVELKNDPPEIFITYEPAILLDIDGQPVRAKIEKTCLEYVIKTHWPLFFETSTSMYFLLAGEQWLQATDLNGPWSTAKKLPGDMKKLPQDTRWASLKKLIPPPKKSGDKAPKVFHSTAPAEIIYINGTPAYTAIPKTQLQYVSNTTSYVFLHTPTKHYYYLTAGRWFRAGTLAGPWTFVTPDLPADFAQIPPTSPAAQVLSSVPGTDEAKDAVLLAQIPVTATVNAVAAAKEVKVTYDGEPKFAPIQGTIPTIYYALNTPQKVIQVNDRYYLCLNAIWFVSSSPQGPWETVRTVPQIIYTIPPSSPVYNVTYVTQTVYPDGTVVSSYTPGYTGVYVMSSSTVIVVTGGTGYYYPPYMIAYPVYGYPVYYPPPPTYGYVAHYHSPTGAYGVSQTAYGPYGSATRTASYNPYTGTSTRTASATTAAGSVAAGQAYNPFTGASAATRQGSNAYGSWGSSVVAKGDKTAYSQHQTNSKGTIGSIQTSNGGKAYGSSTQNGKTVVGKSSAGDVYAGHDGNAYKKTDSGWQKYDNGNWNAVQPPETATPKQQPTQPQARNRDASGGSEQLQSLQQESQNRQRGAQSSQRMTERPQGRSGSSGKSFGGGGSGGRHR